MIEIKNLTIGIISFLFGIALYTDEVHLAEYFLNIAEFIVKSVFAITPNNPQTVSIFNNILLSFKIAGIGITIFGIVNIIEWLKSRE